MEQKTKIFAEEAKQDLLITRVFDLPVELVYKAYTEKELIEQWMGTNVIELESRRHGSYKFETSQNGNTVFSAHGSIHDLIENKEIIRTFEMSNSNIGVQLEIISFESVNSEQSKLNIQIIYKSEAHRAEQLKLPFEFGLNMAHNRLEEIIKK